MKYVFSFVESQDNAECEKLPLLSLLENIALCGGE